MNCTTCRYELSLCLDGRLPSGRRSLVMQHVDECADCAGFWGELQAAQKLALQLPPARVSSGFREELWERIRSGEGTPEAVFREPVPLITKARYALTGAAAAAVVLLCATWLRRESDKLPAELAVAANAPSGTTANDRHSASATAVATFAPSYDFSRLEDSPLVSAAQPLTTDVFALETARQLEQRHALAQIALRRIDGSSGDSGVAIDQALTNAGEFAAFGECLLDLHDRQQLRFSEADVEADLRYAVKMLGGGRLQKRDAATARDVVGPALQSNRLRHVASSISLVPLDPREEREVLVRLNTQRPEVFPLLFFVFGSGEEIRDLEFLRRGQAFMLDDPCGPSWVAPRSEVEARDSLLRSLRVRVQGHTKDAVDPRARRQ